MVTQAEFHGKSQRITISADQLVSRHHAWVWHITASTTGLAVQLPDASELIPGYPVIQIVNEGPNTFAIQDNGGTELIATGDNPQDTVFTFALFDNSDADGDWAWGEWTDLAGAPPAVTVFPWTMGGVDSGLISNAWRFDFVADSWSEPGSTSASTHDYSAGFEIDGVGYIHNGTTPVFEQYDPSSWTTLTARAVDAKNAAGAKHPTDDKGYLLGATAQVDGTRTDSYDVSGAAWSTQTDMDDARHKHAAQRHVDNNKLYYCGGATGFAVNHDGTVDMSSYDITNDVHGALTDATFERLYFATSVDSDDDFWAYGGFEDNNGPDRDDVEKYDVALDSWSTKVDMAQGPNAHGGACHIAANLMNYTIGGVAVTGGIDDDAVYQHNPDNDTYAVQTPHAAASGNVRGICQGTTVSLTD